MTLEEQVNRAVDFQRMIATGPLKPAEEVYPE